MRHARFSIKHLGIRTKRIFIIVVLKTPLKGVNLASVLRMIINAHQVYVSSGNVCKENLLTTQTFYSVSCIQAADKFLFKLVVWQMNNWIIHGRGVKFECPSTSDFF